MTSKSCYVDFFMKVMVVFDGQKIRKYDKYRFLKSQALTKPGTFFLTASCMPMPDAYQNYLHTKVR